MNFSLRKATAHDIPALLVLIKELAVFEKAPDEVSNTKQRMLEDGFGPDAIYDAFVAEVDGTIVGAAITYYRYSTWKGRCLYLEDLIVTESHRGQGIGQALFEHCIEFAKAKGCVRMNWQVLDWNQTAIDFYGQYGAGFDDEWLNGWVDV